MCTSYVTRPTGGFAFGICFDKRMELYLVEALSLSLLFLLIIPLNIDDLSSTKVALLNFAAIVLQGQLSAVKRYEMNRLTPFEIDV
ncbi:hypothetical protein Tco_0613476 [Tanacetum coccineum]